jgi:hypothetical protein
MEAAIKGDFASQLSVYSNGQLTILAPRRWQCNASEGADGDVGLAVYPAGNKQLEEAVIAHSIRVCQRCVADAICPFFSQAPALLGYSKRPCPTAVPKREAFRRSGPNVIAFEDPPGVAGNGHPSGGSNPAEGLLVFLPRVAGLRAAETDVTCTLESSKHSLCEAILSDFLVRVRRKYPRQYYAQPVSMAPATTSSGPAQKAPTLAQVHAKLDREAATVRSDIGSVSQTVARARSDLATMAGDLKKAQGDLAKTKDDLAKTLNNPQVCSGARVVDHDAIAISSEEMKISGHDADGITSDLNAMASGSAALRAHFEKLQTDQTVLPTYFPAGAPDAAVVNSTLTGAGTTARQVRGAMSSYIAQAKQLLRTANAYAAQARAACNKVGG